jgi:predicted metalloprotease
MGAFSLTHFGWIWTNSAFVDGLLSSGSQMPGAYLYAHELGHEIQGHFNALPATTQLRELNADCLAGFYLGSLICRGAVTRDDIATTLGTACVIADGTGDPVADQRTHGTCDQRVSAVARGISAYLSSADALASCSN